MTRPLGIVLIVGALTLARSEPLCAQMGAFNDARGTVEIGGTHEWMHRELGPAPYADTRWSLSTVQLTYDAAAWLRLGVLGGLSQFESEDFPDSEFERYATGGMLALRPWTGGRWEVGALANYLESFDLDYGPPDLNKRVRSFSLTVALALRFEASAQPMAVWAGPVLVDDRVDTYMFDSRASLASTDGAAAGVAAGLRIVLARYVALSAYARQVETLHGGISFALHLSEGGL